MDAGSAEDRLIARYFKPLARHPGTFGFSDDAAAITPPAGHDLVPKTDGLIEGVHFFADDPAESVARKALRVNLSDLAAKGATPLGFLLAIALPKGFSEDWLAAFARGLGEDAETYACPLLGGDTDSTPGPISISISAFGTLPTGTMVRRAGAKVGDHVLVTGTIGDAALGLRLRKGEGSAWQLSDAMRRHLVSRLQLPQPRNALAEAVRTHASAAMDISDGLIGDAAKLCRASQVHLVIEALRVPLSDAARQALDADPAVIQTLFGGGEDYEILCTVPDEKLADFSRAAAAAAVPLTEIGRVMPGPPVPQILDAHSLEITFEKPGYSHF